MSPVIRFSQTSAAVTAQRLRTTMAILVAVCMSTMGRSQKISISATVPNLMIPSGHLCQSFDSVTVTYMKTGTYNSGNIFVLELSDDNGQFPGTDIGSLVTTAAGTIEGLIPNMTPVSSLYKLRIRSTNPQIISTNTTQVFSLDPVPFVDINLSTVPLCENQEYTVPLNAITITNGNF